ncbi:MAG: hypothetical protein PWQ51_511 [Methanolobus sp.]|jgi:hypothetical protein|nr:hypothetical protein [Methanolobus sp.]MDK2826050.1 hypothetical protein [Methanolobus sp.]MDK2831856.1 hypothetical protein [Methanolobus sp.]MDK2938347.1 hypothetical protein [Methanolobus sp.]MDK2948638.1 hypothetical protein [Methanolobus sp.]
MEGKELKNHKLLLIGFVSLIAVFALSMFLQMPSGIMSQASEGSIDESVEYVIETSLPNVDNIYPVLDVENPVVTSESVTEIGKQFGFTSQAGPAGEGMMGILSEDGTEHLLVYEKSGTLFYSKPEKINPVVSSQPDLPSTEEAITIAQNFLEENDLLPSDAKLDKVVADTQTESDKNTGKVLDEYETVLQVMASGREIGGVPIVGPGNKLSVYVGEKGEVVGLIKAWKDVEISQKMVDIKTPDVAYDEMTEGGALFVTTDADTISKVNIKDVYIAYWMEPATEEQDSAMPVYVFEGEAVHEDSETTPFTAYVSATLDATAF